MVCLATFLRTVPKKKFFNQFSGTKFYLKTELQKKFFWDMLGSRTFEGKCKGKKIERKSKRKEKVKENKK